MRSGLLSAIAVSLFVGSTWAAEFVPGPPPGNWAKVESLTGGTQITVSIALGDRVEGNFVRLEEAQLVVNAAGQERRYPRSSITEVSLIEKGSRKKNAAIAGTVAFALGFGAGYAMAPNVADMNDMPAGERIGVGAAMGGVFGGIAAGIAALHRPGVHETVIYRAR